MRILIRNTVQITQQYLVMKENQRLEQSLISQNLDSDPPPVPPQSYLRNLPIIGGDSIIQTIFFTWLNPFLDFSKKHGVTVQTLPYLPFNFTTEHQHENMMKNWSIIEGKLPQGRKLIKTILLTHKTDFIKILCLTVWVIILFLVIPLLTSINIDYIQNHRNDVNYGIQLFFLTLFISILHRVSFTQVTYKLSMIGLKLANSLNMLIYAKSLKYSPTADKKFAEAQILNYSQTDVERLTYIGYHLSAILYGPIQIIFGLLMMYLFIGVSFFSGVAVLVIILLINFSLIKKVNKLNDEVLKAKDERMKVTEQMLEIIRFIKVNTIQKFFFNKLEEKRKKEIQLYFKKGFIFVFVILIFWVSCPLLVSATFITYILLGYSLTAQVAFSVIMLSSLIQFPIHSVPTAISELIQVISSIKRIEKYLQTKQIDKKLLILQTQTNYAINIKNGNFYWAKQKEKKSDQEDQNSKKQQNKKQKKKGVLQNQQSKQQLKDQQPQLIHVLKDINLSIKKGKLVMVIGDIGSGKSSLLMAILNEMIHGEGSQITLSGSIAYSSQKPWIMSQTVEQNILFGEEPNSQKFQKIIYHSAFEQDLKILPQGIKTEIGQKGVNLSGGQKARLSLARALYSNRDIYFLDDILSAVDVHVGDFLVKQTLRGFLSGKTILMPTHAIKYLEQADEIIIMKKGKIVQKGTIDQIGSSAEFKEVYMKENEHKEQQKAQKQGDEELKLEAEIKMLAEAFNKKKTSQQRTGKETKELNQLLVQQLMLPEDQEQGHVNPKIFKHFVKDSGGVRKFMLPILICMFLWIACKTIASIFMEKSCQSPSQDNREVYFYVAFMIGSNIFTFIRSYIMVVGGAKQGKYIHDQMIKSLLYASLSKFFNRVPVGRIINRLTKDLREIDEDISGAMAWLLVGFFELISVLIICIYATSALALIPMAIVGYLSNQVRRYYMKAQRELTRFEKSTNSPVVSGFISTISGLSSIRAYKKENLFVDTQIKKMDKNKRVRLTKAGLQNWFSIVLSLLSFLVNMPCIAYCMFSNSSNPSLVGLLMVYALSLSDSMIDLTLASAYLETKLISIERVYTFMGIEPERDYREYCRQWSAQEEGVTNSFDKGEIVFDRLSAKYREDLPQILKEVSCSIKAGEKVGIVGRTGAGKSTIINTLLKVTQISGGRIFIDGKNFNQYSLKELRHSITMIDQEPTLIKSTFRQNLDLTNRYTDEQLSSILKECNLLEVIKEKGGLEGKVSNTSLSAGEKQLLCICRAFLKQSKIVLIDEATANIDMKNDAIIQRVISEKFRESTVITIAHRLSTLKNSDKIMVMQKGSLIQFGSPIQLQNKPGGFYAQMIAKNEKDILG